ncbi:MAG: T9SS type A sorting domain-containing protein [Fibrobacterota bacterium]
MRYFLCLIPAIFFFSAQAANIFDDPGGNSLTAIEEVDYYRDVTRYDGDQPQEAKLHCRFYRYSNELIENRPLLVFFIQWGGSIDQTEGPTQYENFSTDPFVSLVIMPEKPDGSALNTSNWYYGNEYDYGDSVRTVPWVHNAVIELLNDIKYENFLRDSIFSGVTIDTNRVYGFGHSIGGTACDQICIKHPEIFAAFHGHAGWTRYWGRDNNFFSDGRGCLSFVNIVGGIQGESGGTKYCDPDSSVKIRGNRDQLYLGVTDELYHAFDYTDLGWYFGKTGDNWNYRDPSFPTPFINFTNGDGDNPEAQGDNLQPSLEESRRGYMYHRASGGHTGGGVFIRWNRLCNFRKDQSYLAFTDRNYGLNNFSNTGYFNPLETRGWDHTTIIDETNHYYVELTGSGTSDVTLRRLQNLVHTPGTVYNLQINGSSAGQVTADEYGLVTIQDVVDDATIDLTVVTTGTEASINKSGIVAAALQVSPNPANPSVSIICSFKGVRSADLGIFDAAGRLLKEFRINGSESKEVFWDGTASSGKAVPTGVYYVRLRAGTKQVSEKILLLR